MLNLGNYIIAFHFGTVVVGLVLSLAVFVAYRVICQLIAEKTFKQAFRGIFCKNEIFPFIIIAFFSVIVANMLLYKLGHIVQLYAAAIFAYSLLLLASIDFKTQMLPDIITKPLIAAGIVQGFSGIFTDIQSALLGAIAGYFILWTVNYCFRMVRGIDGMGYGDFKLLSAIGAWCGFQMLPLVILLSSVIGIFVALAIIKATKLNIQAPTPFGPSPVFTGFIAFLYGNDIINWYLGILLQGSGN